MKKTMLLKLVSILAIFTLMLVACSDSGKETSKATKDNSSDKPKTVEITDAHGKVTVPVNPKNVVALDNRTFETLADWGIKLAAAPKDIMPADSAYKKDEKVQNIGNHREPNLEIIAAANPDLVIVGQRFADHYEEIKKLVPNAAVIDLNFDVSEKSTTPGKNLVDGLKNSTTTLGKIFDKDKEAKQLVADFDKSIEKAKSAYNGKDKVMSVIVTGGNIGFAAPHSGRVWGPMYEIFGWTPALEVSNSTAGHKGDDVSVEAIAQTNPDWLFVLDRDAATSDAAKSAPAKDVISKSPALQNTTAVSKKQVVYAPEDTYTNESIQTYVELFGNLAKTLAK
ncbi:MULTISPECIES: siderophore ABC transporter substrate-binding protein [Bacillus cereus group]|uniref:siderophore ABC transporter substrate-binding protein n=1 Tax=Bacillus cereus group TaxID=86661 RepID=UPI00031EDFDA|nr:MULTISPECIES: siderophore ABC transporter substrate-binding protein [Bacillus cereus group]MBR9658537.1 iron ABC transporter substrate-binding protein [Bacillus cereus]MCU4902607.1 siderophore ABC transporter substrate-binding protein [Bacillus cereus]MCU5315510.1 siderophore ABC transporter substrate-binding protein [Bacillus cereus]MCU5440055.1 siderophore ABC transporter substrate-binding protein [Bacillus cereus]MCU5484586.1 siderophore ABC transporter substrate-binding protein [Bacillu